MFHNILFQFKLQSSFRLNKMDKTQIKTLLAPYSPPLSLNQIEAISTEVENLSLEEIKTIKAELKKKMAPKTPKTKKLRK